MASTKPAMLSSLPVVSQVSAYLSPFCTEQYQTMMPSRSCLTASRASFMMNRELVDPLAPSRILSFGTSTWKIFVLENVTIKYTSASYPDGESFPLRGPRGVVLDIEERLVALVDHQPYGIGETVASAAFIPACVNNITLGLNLRGN